MRQTKLEIAMYDLVKCCRRAKIRNPENAVDNIIRHADLPDTEETCLVNDLVGCLARYLTGHHAKTVQQVAELQDCIDGADFRTNKERIEQGESKQNIKQMERTDKRISDIIMP